MPCIILQKNNNPILGIKDSPPIMIAQTLITIREYLDYAIFTFLINFQKHKSLLETQ